MKRLMGFLVLALIIFAIITQPVTAANTAKSIGHTLYEAAESVTVFFQELV